MIAYIFESAAIWFVCLVFYRLFLKKETFFRTNRFYLVFSLVAGLVIPLVQIRVGTTSSLLNYMVPVTEFIPGNMNQVSLVSQSPDQWNMWLTILIFGVYLAGISWVLSKFCLNLFSILTIAQGGSKDPQKNYTEVNIRENISPFTFFRWMFIPEKLKNSTKYELIKNHELAHIRNWHSLDILFIEILRVFFWFNPILWYLKKSSFKTMNTWQTKPAFITRKDMITEIYCFPLTTLAKMHIWVTNSIIQSLKTD